MKTFARIAASAGIAFAFACESSGGGTPYTPAPEPDAAPDTAAPAAETTPWTPGAATTKKPVFGSGCRYEAETPFLVPSNGAGDDALSFSAAATGGPIEATLSVSDGDGVQVEATVTLTPALAGKSWGGAKGAASWNGVSGDVVDGTLCFAEKLAAGAGVEGELSLVLETPAGDHHSVAGTFSLPGAAVTAVDPVDVSAALDIDLR